MRTYILLILTLTACLAVETPAVSHLRCEALDSPNLVDTPVPRFSWRMESTVRGAKQNSYQLRIQELGADGKPVGTATEGARVTSDQSQWLEIPGFKAKAKTHYQWQVRIWDQQDQDSGWSPAATFATSLLDSKWLAEWITDGRPVGKKAAPPARYLRKSFSLPGAPVRATLYLSSYGLVEPWLNGKRVSEDFFVPGWPDYTKRTFYVAYDVTTALRPGANMMGIVLGDGWYSGTTLFEHQFGKQPLASGWIEIIDQAGKTSLIATDGTWQWAEGPITANGIYFGENYDARKEDPTWNQDSGGTWKWQPVKTVGKPAGDLNARYSLPVRRIQELKPISRRTVAPGTFIYDMGQNMVGWMRLKVQAPAGTKITIRSGEMLDADSSIYFKSLRKARATVEYIARGQGIEVWEPHFTYFGFRYVELTGISAPADDAITGVVVHTDLERIGQFECSNEKLNKLYQNTLWSQKGNFLELPTDCPQRDERLGWTGDTQVFCNTANYTMACGPFYRQWLAALRDGYKEGAGYGSVAPRTGFKDGAAGWAESGVIVPWMTYLHTADRRVLEDNFPTIQRWMALLEKQSPTGIRVSPLGYGDWLAPGYEPNEAPTPYPLLATAYSAYSTKLAAHIAEILGNTELAAKYHAQSNRVAAAFCKEYVKDDGTVTSNEQTAYLMALGFDLVPDAMRGKLAAHLAQAVKVKDNHLSTGFLGTPLLLPVLSACNLSDLAYTVVKQESYPGWLFSIKNGATTTWERWNSWTPEAGFDKNGMNSFNHYAYGSVCSWFYDTITGLKPNAAAPGWKRFTIAPVPGGGLTQAQASVVTPYGLAASRWQLHDGHFELDVTVPANTQADISLPAANLDQVSESGKPLKDLTEATNLAAENNRVRFSLPAGSYKFATGP